MSVQTHHPVATTEQQIRTPDAWELDIAFVESGEDVTKLIQMTNDGCGKTCASACPASCP